MTLQEQAQTPHKPVPYKFSPDILREYDIRGRVDVDLCVEDAYAIGCAFGSYVKKDGGQTMCVGYDGRHSSPIFAQALIQGLVDVGIDVENIGLGPTPMLYFAVKDRLKDAGVMITGSHNPPDYNGFKMTMQSKQIFGDIIQEIGKIAETGDYTSGTGSSREIDIKETYVERLLKDLTKADLSSKKIAWDCGNGAAGEIIQMLTSKMPGEHILMFEDIDADFPNHHPDPTVDENLIDIIDVVRTQHCDLGVAFDGDGDRVGVVDEKGQILRSDLLTALYAKEILESSPGAPIVADVKCSQVLFDEIKRLGGTPVMWKTGHSLLKDKMAELKSPLGGELSGHIVFADKWYGFDDGIYCAIRLINEIVENGAPLSTMTTHLPVLCNTPEIRFEVDETQKFAIVEEITARLKQRADAEGFEVMDMDGIRLSTKDGWWLLRASNTQNALATRAEARTPEALEKLKEMVSNEVKKFGYKINFDSE